MASSIDTSGRGAAYIRVSEDVQDDRRQRTAIDGFLARHGVAIQPADLYAEHGFRDRADQRVEFQQMLAAVQSGRYQWIVLAEDDRLGWASELELFHYLYIFDRAGCRLYTADDHELGAADFAQLVNTAVRGNNSVVEGRRKSERVLGAMRELARRGEWGGGYVPFGLDVVCLGRDDLRERWRVQMLGRDLRVKIAPNGTRRDYNGRNNFPVIEAGEVLQLRPSFDDRHVSTVRTIFERFAAETITPNQIARDLNAANAPLPYYSRAWTYKHVSHILKNPVYVGNPAWNKHTAGKYGTYVGGRKVDRRPGMKQQQHDRADWVISERRLFDPIVAPDLFERVQAKLAEQSKLHHKRRAPKSPALWLSGIAVCGGCGKPMHGKTDTKTRRATYVCSTYINNGGPKPGACAINTITHDWLLEQVRAYLDDAGQPLDQIGNAALDAREQPQEFADALMRAASARVAMMSRTHERAFFFFRDGDAEARAVDEFRRIFTEQAGRDRARLDQIQAEYREQVRVWKDLPTERARATAKQIMADLEAEMEELEDRTRDHAAEYVEAQDEVRRLGREWEQARHALESASNARRKADAVRRVIAQIVLHFDGSKRKPTDPPARWEIVPAISPQSRTSRGLQGRQGANSTDPTPWVCQGQSGSPSP